MSTRLLVLTLCLTASSPALARSSANRVGGSAGLVGNDAPRVVPKKTPRGSAGLLGHDAPRVAPKKSTRAGSASLIGDDAPRTRVASGTKTALKAAVRRLIADRNQAPKNLHPKVGKIIVTATNPGPNGSTVVTFDVKVGRDWFGGIQSSVSGGKGKLVAGTLTFGDRFTENNIVIGDNRLE